MNVFVIVLFVCWVATVGIAVYWLRKADKLYAEYHATLLENERLIKRIRVLSEPFPEYSRDTESIKNEFLLEMLQEAMKDKNPTSDGEDTRK